MCGQFSNPVTEKPPCGFSTIFIHAPIVYRPVLVPLHKSEQCVKFYTSLSLVWWQLRWDVLILRMQQRSSQILLSSRDPNQDNCQNKAMSKLYSASLGFMVLLSCCWSCFWNVGTSVQEPGTTSITTEQRMCFLFRHTGTPFTFPVWVHVYVLHDVWFT